VFKVSVVDGYSDIHIDTMKSDESDKKY